MRGVPESRNLAVAITRRARGPSYTRNFSAGAGRGRGGNSGRYDDAEEPLFGSSVGHGAPRGGTLNAGFPGPGGPPNSASGPPGAPIGGFGSSSAGRGFNNSNQTPASHGPLLSNVSFGRGSMFRNQGEDVFSDAKLHPRPSFDLGSGGFGRGKPVEKTEAPEDIFSSDRRATLSNWSQWDEKSREVDTKEAPSPSELRLMQDEQSIGIPFPVIPQRQPGQWGQERQTQAFQSPASASRLHADPSQQQPPSSPGRQPIQQPNYTDKAPPIYTTPPAGWQHPVQQPYDDARVPPQPSMLYSRPPPGWQQQPAQQPYYDVRIQPQPSFQYRPPSTGYQQPAQQPFGDPRVQPEPSTQYVPPSKGYQQPAQQPFGDPRFQPHPSAQYTPPSTDLNSGWQQPAQQPFYDPRAQPQPPFQYSQPSSGWQHPGQQPYYDPRVHPQSPLQYTPAPSTGWQQPVQQPFYDATGQPQPFGQYTPPPSGWQPPVQQPPVQQPSYDANLQPQPQPSVQFAPPPTDLQPPTSALPSQPSGWQQPVQQPYYDANLQPQPQPSVQFTSPPTDLKPPTSALPSQAATPQQQWQLPGSPPSSPGRQPMQQLDVADKATPKSTIPFAETSSSGPNVKSGPNDKDYGAFSSSRNMDAMPTASDAGAQSFSSFERSESLLGIGMGRGIVRGSSPDTGIGRGKNVDSFLGTAGMGRGKKVESFFNFDFLGGLGSGDRVMDSAKQSIQMDQESKTDVQDEYSQTFAPVIHPGLYGFAPEGVSVGPGAGRGRPHSPPPLSPQPLSPQAHGIGLDTGPLLQFEIGPDRGNSAYQQRMQAALQRPPLYSMDSQSLRAAELEYDYPEEEEPVESSLAEEEAAERAMKILQGRVERSDGVRRRTPLQLAQSLRQRRQPQELMKMEKKITLTKEEQKKEAERLKALEENETLRELQHTFDQFMKCYGEMGLEPEHELGDFTNPDIEEKPFMPLEEYLEKAKPNIMKTGLIRSEKEWQDMVKDTMSHVPYYEEFVERYSGPGRYTAKQENEDLEEIAGTLPLDSGRAANAFVQRSLTTLKSNPAFNLQQKQWLLASMVDEFSQYIVMD